MVRCPKCGVKARIDVQVYLPQKMNDEVHRTAAIAGKFAISHVSKVMKIAKHPAVVIPVAIVGGIALIGAAVAGNNFQCSNLECGHRFSVLDKVTFEKPRFLRNPFGPKAS